jgi:hypothetical protein
MLSQATVYQTRCSANLQAFAAAFQNEGVAAGCCLSIILLKGLRDVGGCNVNKFANIISVELCSGFICKPLHPARYDSST